MKSNLYLISFFIAFLFSCSYSPSANPSSDNQERKKEPENKNTDKVDSIYESVPDNSDPITKKIILKGDYNDIALFLSGKPLNKKSPYFELTKDSSFIKYARSTEKNYEKYKDRQLVKISEWSKTELAEIHEKSKTIFYPFSGPDILHALTLFPNGKDYYLFGLEPVGEIPDLQNIPLDSMNKLFSALNKSISDNLNLSFFITKKMHSDLNSGYIKGTIPLLLFFLAKMNYPVQDIRPVKISDDGTLEIKERNMKSNRTNFGKGVEISFVDTSTNEIKKVCYFSMDLSEAGFKKHSGMQNFINSFEENVTTLVKSASYCLHGTKYNTIRDIILDKTKYLLQDDTGIPYSCFNEKNRIISLYGSYEKPVKVFEMHYQDDFKKAMDEKAKPISFRFGYNKESNILVGKKK